MSQVDVAKANLGRSPVSPAERQFTGLVQPGRQMPVPVIVPQEQEVTTPEVRYRPRQRKAGSIVSVATIQPADLEPISSQGSDKLLHSLTRIDLVLGELAQQELSEGGAQSFMIGKSMVAETIRRLRLMQSGQAYVMMGR